MTDNASDDNVPSQSIASHKQTGKGIANWPDAPPTLLQKDEI